MVKRSLARENKEPPFCLVRIQSARTRLNALTVYIYININIYLTLELPFPFLSELNITLKQETESGAVSRRVGVANP